MAGINTYKKKVEAYIKQQDSAQKSTVTSKGLLAPKNFKPTDVKKEKDAIEKVSEFVYALRQKRKEILIERNKK
jgi:hypothetical protein